MDYLPGGWFVSPWHLPFFWGWTNTGDTPWLSEHATQGFKRWQVKAKKGQLPSGFSYYQRRNTFLGTTVTLSPPKGTFEDDLPVPKMGYVSSLKCNTHSPPRNVTCGVTRTDTLGGGIVHGALVQVLHTVLLGSPVLRGVGLTPAPVQTHEPNRLAWLHLNVNPDWLLNSPAHVCSILTILYLDPLLLKWNTHLKAGGVVTLVHPKISSSHIPETIQKWVKLFETAEKLKQIGTRKASKTQDVIIHLKKKRDPPGRRKLGHNHGQQGISRIDPDLHGTFHQWFAGQGLLITSLLFSSLEATGLLNNLFTFKGWNPQNMNHRKNPWNVIDFQQEWKADSGDRNMMKYYEV